MSNVRMLPEIDRHEPIDESSLRVGLLEKRQELLQLYRHDVQVGQESTDEGTEDLVDRANNSYNRELMFSLSDAERSLMFMIDEALGRLEDGSFGTCGHCGDPVGARRLKAIPWARYCVGCQEREEQGLLEA